MIQIPKRTLAALVAVLTAVAGVAVAALVVALGAPAAADHHFPDVAANSPFHDEVSWLTDPNHQIATGFGDGTFHPRDGINRQQAAFWFTNYNNQLEVVERLVLIANDVEEQTGHASCPAGKRPVAGGYDGPSEPWTVTRTSPTDQFGGAWVVRWDTGSNGVQDFPGGTVWALCIPEQPPN